MSVTGPAEEDGLEELFDWDDGNIGKNLAHGVQDWEIEETCLDPMAQVTDYEQVRGEGRSILLGRAPTSGKYLRVVYTLRPDRLGNELIRPISAVEMTPSERKRYQRK
ncbi:MAG: BrnT family toxin [Armatimonadetes bacterium]|nr:BrnT family toxin [Armatimonadota bacterium]